MSIIIDNQQSHLTLPVADAHTAPTSGNVSLYVKTDGSLYKKDSTGVESAVGGGGALPWGEVAFGLQTSITSSPYFYIDTDMGEWYVDFSGLSNVDAGLNPRDISLIAAHSPTATAGRPGGHIILDAGNALAGSNSGGKVDIFSGTAVVGSAGGSGGDINIQTGTGQYGGTIYLTSGIGTGFGNGGPIYIYSGGGTGGDAGGGPINIQAGGGNSSGDIVINCATVTTAFGNRGGYVDIMGGRSTGTTPGVGGRVAIIGGQGGSGGNQPSGAFYVYGGNLTLGAGTASTSACTLSQVKESIQVPTGIITTAGNLPDVSDIPCARRLVVGGQSGSATLTLSLPVQIPTNSVWMFRADVAISYLQYGADFAGYEITGVLTRVGDVVTLYSPVTTVKHESAGASGWDVVAQANTVDKTLQFVCTVGGGFRTVAIAVDVTQPGWAA